MIYGFGLVGVVEVIGVLDLEIVGNEIIWGDQYVCVNMILCVFSFVLFYFIFDLFKCQKFNKMVISFGFEEDFIKEQDEVEEVFYKKVVGGVSFNFCMFKKMFKVRKKGIEREFKWVQFGGLWEEYLFIYDNVMYVM